MAFYSVYSRGNHLSEGKESLVYTGPIRVTIGTDKMGLLEVKKLDSCYQYGYEATIKEINKIKEIIQEK